MTESEERELLEAYAVEVEPGRWFFRETSGYSVPHSRESMLAIIRACVALDVRVTDIITGETWGKLVDEIVDLTNRVDELERNTR